MVRTATRVLKTLKIVANNPDITSGSIKKMSKETTSIKRYKSFLIGLEEQGLLESSLALNNLPIYSVTDKGKAFIEEQMPKGKALQDYAGDCDKCKKYSTHLSIFQGEKYCPDCLNHDDYREPPFKCFSAIDLCSRNF